MSLTEQELIERRRGYERKYYRNPANRHKDLARGAVLEALKSGRLVRADACEKCGHGTVEAHHEDYSKPLDVNWLCRKCHKAIHRKTHCLRGHLLSPERVYKSGACKQCARERFQEKKAHKCGDLAERLAPWRFGR